MTGHQARPPSLRARPTVPPYELRLLPQLLTDMNHVSCVNYYPFDQSRALNACWKALAVWDPRRVYAMHRRHLTNERWILTNEWWILKDSRSIFHLL